MENWTVLRSKYGHSGTSVILEAMAENLQSKIIPTESMRKQEELDKRQKQGVHPMSTFTTAEKFHIGLQMTE